MKNLKDYINEAKTEPFKSPNFDMTPEEGYKTFIIDAGVNVLNEFDYKTARFNSDYPEGFEEYSKSAINSLNSGGKKYAKLLEKLFKPKFFGKTTKTVEELKKEFYSAEYFKDEAWEWAPGAGTDLLYNYWDMDEFFDDLKEYFGEEDE